MRRPIKKKSNNWREYDVRKDIKAEQLAGIGAVSIGFNDLEAITNTLLPIVLETPFPLWPDLVSRINGLETKFDLIKHSVRAHLKLPDDVADLVCGAIGGVNEARHFRDAVIHAKIINPADIIAPTVVKKGKEYEVLVSVEALDWLNDLISALRHELAVALELIYQLYVYKDHRFKRPVTILSDGPDPETVRLEQEIQRLTVLLRQNQKYRRSLPPPPKFPEEQPETTPPESDSTPKESA